MKRKLLRRGTVLQQKGKPSKLAYVMDIFSNHIVVIIDGKKSNITNGMLDEYWELLNPIKDNRIVSNKTFATRFRQFLKWIPEDWWMSQPHYYEEFQYMDYVSEMLLAYQIDTATDEDEVNYLKRMEKFNLL